MNGLMRRGSKKKGASQSHLRQVTLFDNFLVTRGPSPASTFARTPVDKGDGSEEQATAEKASTKDNESQVFTDVLEPLSKDFSDDRNHIDSSLCSSRSSTQGTWDVGVENSQDNYTTDQEHIPPSSPFSVDLAPICSLAEVAIVDSCSVGLGTPSSLPALDLSCEDSSHIIDLTMEEEAETTPILVDGSPILEAPPAHMAPPSHIPFQRLLLGKWKEKPSPDAPFPSASMQHVRDSVLSVQAMPIGLGQRQGKTTRASPEPSTSREPLKVGSSTGNIATRHVGSYRRVRGSERQANATAVLSCHGDLHPAVSSIFGLASELEDVKEPSQQHWNQKWRPRRAEHILGNEHNACFLREWMHALRLHFDTTPSSHGKSSKSKKKSRKRKRGNQRPEIVREVTTRKRMRAGNLNGWLVDDEDDEDEINEEYGGYEDFDSRSSPSSLDLNEPQPISFGKKIRNTILLVGPPGCGKTAAVYACAEELGWNVFEVYPGLGKRGGTHLDELIGDVGKNHTLPQPLLFHRGRSEPPSPARKRPTDFVDTSDKVPEADIHPQSVVLIEEADVVFADEAGFWPSVVAFIKECRRPVIITCNDISLIPLDMLPLQTTLIFNTAPASLTSSLLNAICQVEGRPPVEPEDAHLERQDSTADLRQRISQCQFGLTDSTCGKPVEIVDVAADVDFSFQVKLEKTMVVKSEPDERKTLYALQQCLRGADAASFLDACVLLARPHDLEVADNHPDDEVGYRALKTSQRATIPVHPEYYSRDVEMATTVLIAFEGLLERKLPGMISLDDAGERGQWTRREEYRRRLWDGLKTDPALEGMVDLPRLYLDYRPLIGVMVKAEDEEIARVTRRVKGRSSRLTERSCRWLNATEELRGAVRAAGGLAGG